MRRAKKSKKQSIRKVIFVLIVGLLLLLQLLWTQRESRSSRREIEVKLLNIFNQKRQLGVHENVFSVEPFHFTSLCSIDTNGTEIGLEPWLSALHHRYEAVTPRQGGPTATVRFVVFEEETLTRRLFAFLAYARLAGVPVEIIQRSTLHGGSYLDHEGLLVTYADALHLRDEDVVVLLHTDMLFTGIDVFPLVQEFVSSTPPTPTECHTRNARQSRNQTAPLLFMWSKCTHLDDNCVEEIFAVNKTSGQWYLPETREANPKQGSEGNYAVPIHVASRVSMTRVWALRRLHESFLLFTKKRREDNNITGIEHFISQHVDDFISSAYTHLYWILRDWEWAQEKAALQNTSITPAPPLYDLIPGMLGLEMNTKYLGVVREKRNDRKRFFFNNNEIDSDRLPFSLIRQSTLQDLLDKRVLLNFTATGAAMSSALLSFKPVLQKFNRFHRFGAIAPRKRNVTYVFEAYKDGTPAVWFAVGEEKEDFLVQLLDVLPTRIVLDVMVEKRVSAAQVLFASINPVWSVRRNSTKLEAGEDVVGDALCSIFSK